MSRLHRKCFFASTTVHALLLGVLSLGFAFRDSRPEPPISLPPLDVIPSRLIEAELSGGAEPKPQPPPTPAPEPRPEPVVEPRPRPPAPRPEPEPEPISPPKETEVKQPKPKPAPPKPRKITVNRKTIPVTQPQPRKSDRPVPSNVANELTKTITDALQTIERESTGATAVTVPGPGNEAFASYSQLVISVYSGNWIKPPGIQRLATVKASVTIARDGRVVSTRITQLSGNRAVDDSVEQVLQRVKTVGRPFPETNKDDTRVFNLSFELNPADLTG